jgi:hypothetical protein
VTGCPEYKIHYLQALKGRGGTTKVTYVTPIQVNIVRTTKITHISLVLVNQGRTMKITHVTFIKFKQVGDIAQCSQTEA